jgi:hypothetical protein
MEVPADWHLNDENKDAKKLNEMVTALAKRLLKSVSESESDEEKFDAVHVFYRKYYTLTLSKSNLATGINKSPARDIILDYPWKDLELHRFTCMKIWEKINH